MDELNKMYSGDLGYNGSDKNYLDFYDDGVTVNYDYYPYFLAEQIYQTPTGPEIDTAITRANEMWYSRIEAEEVGDAISAVRSA